MHDQDEIKVLCMLAEQRAILETLVAHLEKQDACIAAMDERLGRKIDAVHSCLLGKLDKMDERLRDVEKSGAVYGTTAGALISTLITMGLHLILGKSPH